jgi:hypothetical protein
MKKELQSKDLRIGNLVYDYFREIIVDVKLNVLRSIETNERCLYKPIPLTKDWLMKFGFVFKVMGISGAVCTRHTGHWYKNGKPYFAGCNGKDNFDIFLQFGEGVEIVFIHELQNLYFALTGEELELKNVTP